MDPMLLRLLAGVGALLVAVSLPLWMGRVGPNRFYGFRTPRLVHDERVWYPTNKVAGRDLALAGTALMAEAAALSVMGLPTGGDAEMWLVAAVLAPVLLAVVHMTVFASRYVYQLDEGEVDVDVESAPAVEPAPEERVRRAQKDVERG